MLLVLTVSREMSCLHVIVFRAVSVVLLRETAGVRGGVVEGLNGTLARKILCRIVRIHSGSNFVCV